MAAGRDCPSFLGSTIRPLRERDTLYVCTPVLLARRSLHRLHPLPRRLASFLIQEKKKGARYYEALLSEPWLRVRNVVSDADKLEALGTVGLERCRHYQLELDPALSDAALYANVVQHCRDKLFRLSDEYMRTPAGMRAAQSKRAELVDALLDWSLQLLSH